MLSLWKEQRDKVPDTDPLLKGAGLNNIKGHHSTNSTTFIFKILQQ
jgi:hypothetical protein